MQDYFLYSLHHIRNVTFPIQIQETSEVHATEHRNANNIQNSSTLYYIFQHTDQGETDHAVRFWLTPSRFLAISMA